MIIVGALIVASKIAARKACSWSGSLEVGQIWANLDIHRNDRLSFWSLLFSDYISKIDASGEFRKGSKAKDSLCLHGVYLLRKPGDGRMPVCLIGWNPYWIRLWLWSPSNSSRAENPACSPGAELRLRFWWLKIGDQNFEIRIFANRTNLIIAVLLRRITFDLIRCVRRIGITGWENMCVGQQISR